ncbi:hypothetical protein RRG08_001093 [Elysia crispata]|uniref:Uncharacterized protein n=1 Tax=Elysia crispata TaxID=231223 RepID=A0AAE1AW35_9GAST|nr:hypothetical protein RRG08_001093 [Elysia crispata]
MDTWVKRRPLFCSAKWAHKSGTAQYEVQLTPMSADYRPRSLTPVYSCHRWTVVTEAFDSPIFFYKRKSGNVLLDLVTAVFINSSGGPAATLTNHNHGLCCFLFCSERIVSDNMDTKRESWPSIIIGSAGHEQRDFEEDMHAHGQSELDTPQVVYYTEAVTRASFQEIITG